MKAVIFGAGNIGRGLVGEVLAESGYGLTFVDVDAAVVRMLNEAGQYEIESRSSKKVVRVERAIEAREEADVRDAVAGSSLIATAVGAGPLERVAPLIGDGLAVSARDHVNVLACENMDPNSGALRSSVVEATGEASVAGIGFPEVVVDRIAPGDPRSPVVKVEDTFEFVVDSEEWVGPIADGPAVFSQDLNAYRLRKLWLVNGVHFAAAVLGLRRGHRDIHEAVADGRVGDVLRSMSDLVAETLAGVTQEFALADLREYGDRTMVRFQNAELADRTTRVARNPLGKLAADERILGPCNRAQQLGLDPGPFVEVIAHAMTIDNPEVEGLSDLRGELSRRGHSHFLTQHCGVAADSDLQRRIGERVEELLRSPA